MGGVQSITSGGPVKNKSRVLPKETPDVQTKKAKRDGKTSAAAQRKKKVLRLAGIFCVQA